MKVFVQLITKRLLAVLIKKILPEKVFVIKYETSIILLARLLLSLLLYKSTEFLYFLRIFSP